MKHMSLAVILSFGFVVSAFATSDGPDVFKVRNIKQGDFLFIRERPSLQASKLGKIPPVCSWYPEYRNGLASVLGRSCGNSGVID